MKLETVNLEILKGISAQVVDGLDSDLSFCHPGITGINKIDPVNGTIVLEVRGDLSEDDLADLRNQAAKVVKMSIESFRFVEETSPLWHHRPSVAYNGNDSVKAFTELHMTTLGPGQYAYHGPANRLFIYFSNRINKIAQEMNAEGWFLPSIEMTNDLIPETGYFSSHPQLITFGYRLPPHYEKIKSFAETAKEKKLTAPEDCGILEPTGFILEPFVCHNIYRSLKNERIDGGRVISAQGKCYRYEGFRFSPLLRQWEFSMREIVLVGEHDFVVKTRQRGIELTQEMVSELDIDANLQIATDPFFVSTAASARTFQMMQSTKLELLLRIDDGKRTAAVSFNIHGKHFTTPMKIYDKDGVELETSCLAYGIERWMAAFIARWGEDPAKWPDFVGA
ncbi:MAG: hypothetical protein Q7U10_01500 [Thermodesulfovibrionia bacterium]|nr:hypothetical protein [Thermodesulfovibrionia bacterium]